MRLTTADGLASNYVRAIFEDADGTLWIGTPSGVSRLSIDSLPSQLVTICPQLDTPPL